MNTGSTEKIGEENMKVIIDVPFVSQNSDQVNSDWHNNSCGIACAKMIIDYFVAKNSPHEKSPIMNTLIDQGLAINGFGKNGWEHSAIVRLMNNYSVMSYAQAFRSVNVIVDKIDGTTFSEGKNYPYIQNLGIAKIIRKLKSGLPVIVSVDAHFNDNKESHLIVLVGYESENSSSLESSHTGQNTEFFYYHDPDTRNGVIRQNQPILVSDFLQKWRKFAIFVD